MSTDASFCMKTSQQKRLWHSCYAWVKSWPATCNLLLLSLYFHMCHSPIHPCSQGLLSLGVGMKDPVSNNPVCLAFYFLALQVISCPAFCLQSPVLNDLQYFEFGVLFCTNMCAGVETIGHKVPFKVHVPQCKIWPKLVWSLAFYFNFFRFNGFVDLWKDCLSSWCCGCICQTLK